MLSNDDGVFASGIAALATAFLPEHEVFLSAPDRERSAASNSMTLSTPLRATPVHLPALPEARAFAVDGTPVDCVRLGLGNLFPRPDVVLSGINHGFNLATDTLYSGTVSAAFEAALLGYPAVAVSIGSFTPQHLDTAAHFGFLAAQHVLKHPMPFGMVLNVNVPDLPLSEIRGVRAARTGVHTYRLAFIEREDPMGKPYYWPPRKREEWDNGPDTDCVLAREGYVTLTPLGFDLTNAALLADLDVRGWR